MLLCHLALPPAQRCCCCCSQGGKAARAQLWNTRPPLGLRSYCQAMFLRRTIIFRTRFSLRKQPYQSLFGLLLAIFVPPHILGFRVSFHSLLSRKCTFPTSFKYVLPPLLPLFRRPPLFGSCCQFSGCPESSHTSL